MIRATTLLDPSTHPDVAAFEPFGFHAGRGEGALQAPQSNHGKIPRPTPPKIHIYSGPALAYRQDLASHKRESAALGS
jgi:hypothetical protein